MTPPRCHCGGTGTSHHSTSCVRRAGFWGSGLDLGGPSEPRWTVCTVEAIISVLMVQSFSLWVCEVWSSFFFADSDSIIIIVVIIIVVTLFCTSSISTCVVFFLRWRLLSADEVTKVMKHSSCWNTPVCMSYYPKQLLNTLSMKHLPVVIIIIIINISSSSDFSVIRLAF